MRKEVSETVKYEESERWSWTRGVGVEVVDRRELLAAAKKGKRSAIAQLKELGVFALWNGKRMVQL